MSELSVGQKILRVFGIGAATTIAGTASNNPDTLQQATQKPESAIERADTLPPKPEIISTPQPTSTPKPEVIPTAQIVTPAPTLESSEARKRAIELWTTKGMHPEIAEAIVTFQEKGAPIEMISPPELLGNKITLNLNSTITEHRKYPLKREDLYRSLEDTRNKTTGQIETGRGLPGPGLPIEITAPTGKNIIKFTTVGQMRPNSPKTKMEWLYVNAGEDQTSHWTNNGAFDMQVKGPIATLISYENPGGEQSTIVLATAIPTPQKS